LRTLEFWVDTDAEKKPFLSMNLLVYIPFHSVIRCEYAHRHMRSFLLLLLAREAEQRSNLEVVIVENNLSIHCGFTDAHDFNAVQ